MFYLLYDMRTLLARKSMTSIDMGKHDTMTMSIMVKTIVMVFSCHGSMHAESYNIYNIYNISLFSRPEKCCMRLKPHKTFTTESYGILIVSLFTTYRKSRKLISDSENKTINFMYSCVSLYA